MSTLLNDGQVSQSPLKLVLAGGYGGIGRAVAQEAQRLGMDVFILDLPASIERHQVEGLPHFAMDAKDPDSVDRAMAQAAARLGGIDACVNLIGFMTAPQSLASTSIDTWQEVIHGNLDAAFYLSRAALPYLHKSDRAALVHIASGLGAWARPNFGAYGPAKAGIILLTRQLALENAPAVRVNAVAPGAVDTAFLRGGTGRSDEQDAPSLNPGSYGQVVPLGRIAIPQDIVGPVMFLLSDAAAYMTGQTLHVNGGTYMP
ncbi:MAG: short-chain dehydrogenase [Rhodospirillaceae bacterium]|nr:MAG: short-chain dehydrogenase [Rhodospirillaceae bacterium]